MQAVVLKEQGLSREIEVTVTAKEIDERVNARLLEVVKTIQLPGFRKGKVPMSIAKQKYGRAVMGEVLELAVNETTDKVMKDKGIKPAMQPKIEVKEFDEGKDLKYSIAVEILPEIKVKDFKGLKLTKQVASPDKKAVEESLDRIAAGNTTSEAITEKRASKKDDILLIDFHGRTADDNKEHPGMHAHGHQLKLGSGQFIPGFEEQLIGKKAGEKVEVKVSFPEAYHAAELAGRDAIFDVEIHEIRAEKKGAVDDELAKRLGMKDVDALKKAVEEQLQKDLDGHSRLKLKKDLLDKLDDMHKFDVPPGMLDLEHKTIVRQVEMEQEYSGSKEKLSEADKKELLDIAGRRVRLGLILAEIGNSNKITVNDAELQRAVISEAQRYRGQEKEVFDYYSQNRQALESLRAPIFEDKVVDFILELADITEKKVSVDELTADDEEAAAPKKEAKKSEAKKEGGEKKKAPAKKK
ncbi:MAG: trigger factor [Alphaproteobacteria bacterium]|nr:trigger factor [Alphaproteobacteria bacterium]MCD8570141.1 trigger factor [Alphaproteobacteria bacterium]